MCEHFLMETPCVGRNGTGKFRAQVHCKVTVRAVRPSGGPAHSPPAAACLALEVETELGAEGERLHLSFLEPHVLGGHAGSRLQAGGAETSLKAYLDPSSGSIIGQGLARHPQ